MMLLLVKALAQTRKITRKSISSVEGQQVILIVLQLKKKNKTKQENKCSLTTHSCLPARVQTYQTSQCFLSSHQKGTTITALSSAMMLPLC